MILIVLVVVGIIFRDTLRDYWLRMKSGFGRSSRPGRGPPGPRPRGPPPSYHRPHLGRHIPERRILLPALQQPRRHAGKPVKSRAQKELDDVLNKLKGIGK